MILAMNIDEELANEVSDIKNGKSALLQQRMVALERMKEKQIIAADRYRKLQIKNINQLYEYEIEDANALFAVSRFHIFMKLISWSLNLSYKTIRKRVLNSKINLLQK